MTKKKKNEIDGELLWGDINEQDFLNESDNIIDVDTKEYNKKQMIGYIQNMNLMRHFPRIGDSLKPVERRGMYTLFEDKSFVGKKPDKSSVIVGHTMTYHPHGDSTIYGTLVGLAQAFTHPVPLVAAHGNFGDDEDPNGYAHMRYTEMTMSKYGQDCFFSDYDDDCIEKIFSTAKDQDEPLVLPSKYPNILVNGGFGIATGHQYCIPPYNIGDIVKLMKHLLYNPDYDNIYIMPDLPTGCNIVDNGTLREICETGNGVLNMRSTITVEENPKKPNLWILRVHNLPWMTGLNTVMDSLTKLTRDGVLPIKDVHNFTYSVKVKSPNGGYYTRRQIQLDILINRAHDPHQIIEKLYKRTPLQKSMSVNFKVVTDALEIDLLNMRNLCNIWIDTRREYLRRRVNKKIAKLSAQISLLQILIYLTDKNNLEKTVAIIKNNNADDAVKALMRSKDVKINSYQAEKIVDSKLRAFSKDAHARYKKELKETISELKKYEDMTKSTKRIDEIIDMQLDDLKKYDVTGGNRRCKIVSATTEREIPNTDHFVVTTKLGMIKKLPFDESYMARKKGPTYGAFKNQDYTTHGVEINNHDSLMAFDNFGMYSCIPVHEIENTEPSQFGSRVYDILKLNGEIVTLSPFINQDLESFVKETLGDIYVITLTKNGYLKKTPIEEYTQRRNQKNVRAMKIREGDELVSGKIVIERKKKGSNLIIFTEKGCFSYIHSDNIANQSKSSSGLLSIKLDPADTCNGMIIVGENDSHLLVITEKGCMKRCELDYMNAPGKRKVSSYLTRLNAEDKVYFVDSIEDDMDIIIYTSDRKNGYNRFNSGDIPIKTRMSMCVKMIPVPIGSKIISVTTQKSID